MKKVAPYKPVSGWFDLSKLDLPKDKLRTYTNLQKLGAEYQKTYAYQKRFNLIQLEQLKELCSQMELDLILNYGALESEATNDN